MAPGSKWFNVVVAVIVLGSVTVFVGVPYFTKLFSFTKSYSEDAAATLAMDSTKLEFFRVGNRSKPELKESSLMVDRVDFARYIYFRPQLVYVDPRNDDMPKYTHALDVSVNTALGIMDNTGSELDGMIIGRNESLVVGYYTNGDRRLSAGFNTANLPKAMKEYMVLMYVTLPDYEIVHLDTVWGGEPPQWIDNNIGAMGEMPSDEDIVGAIKSTMQ